MLLNQILERNTHLFLDDARVIDVSTDTKQLGPLVSLPPKASEPRPTAPANRRRNRDSLHIRHRSRTPKQAHVGGKRRLQPRLALLSFYTLNEGRFLPANVRARPAVDVHVKVVPGPARVLANQTGPVRLVDGLLEVRRLLVEFTANVDVCRVGVHGAPRDEAAFDKLVRVAAEDFAVFAGSGFTFVGVDDEVSRSFGSLQ